MVSVVIPALDEEEGIGSCLRALRAQTVPAEIIVVDNGSVDGTVEIAQRYADQVHVLPGRSLRDIKQFGVEAASNDIIVTTDADTVAPPEWLEKLLRHFSDPRVVAVGGPAKSLTPGTIPRLYAQGLSAAAQAGLLFDANMAFRRDVMLGSGGYAHLKRGWDWELAARLRRHGRVVFDPEAYVYTDVPLSRQLEFSAMAANAGLLGVGAATRSPLPIGLGSGFFLAQVGSALDNVPDGLHHSQVAVAGLGLLSLFGGAISQQSYRFLAGLLTGVLGHHFITEDIFNPVGIGITGPLLTGITLLLLAW